jgi:HEAT repeat protein
LSHDDRHVRGIVAFVFGRLGESRGFETIAGILADRAPRSPGQGIPGGGWSLAAQIRSDRYYAAHLLGDLKDPRGVELLVGLLNDPEVEYIVPWSLAAIGEDRAIPPLIGRLERDDPSVRVLAIAALERLNAREALPRLRELLQDSGRRISAMAYRWPTQPDEPLRSFHNCRSRPLPLHLALTFAQYQAKERQRFAQVRALKSSIGPADRRRRAGGVPSTRSRRRAHPDVPMRAPSGATPRPRRRRSWSEGRSVHDAQHSQVYHTLIFWETPLTMTDVGVTTKCRTSRP